jgi:hypothetical protein
MSGSLTLAGLIGIVCVVLVGFALATLRCCHTARQAQKIRDANTAVVNDTRERERRARLQQGQIGMLPTSMD